MQYRFTKMQGCGNDFLIYDAVSDYFKGFTPEEVRYLCNRHYGLGADGLVELHDSDEAHARWKFHNCDGSEAEMCGNAARCVMRYLGEGLFKDEEVVSLDTRVGVIKGRVMGENDIEVTLFPEEGDGEFPIEERVLKVENEAYQVYRINTGVPHAVVEVEHLEGFPVSRVGRAIQQNAIFKPEGTNVTFFQRRPGNQILSTTFERGVEQETYACGTGAAAAALVYTEVALQSLPVEVTLPGGNLIVDLSPASKRLLLRGNAEYVGVMECERPPVDFKIPTLFEQADRSK